MVNVVTFQLYSMSNSWNVTMYNQKNIYANEAVIGAVTAYI